MSVGPKKLLFTVVTLVVGLVAVVLLVLWPMLSSPVESLAVYDVEGDVLSDQSADPAHREVWTRFNEIFPADTHPEVSRFRAIDAVKSGGIDGASSRQEHAWGTDRRAVAS